MYKTLFVSAIILISLISLTGCTPKVEKYFDRGMKKIAKGNYIEGEAYLTRSIKIDPYNTEAYYNRGFARYMANNTIGALADFNKVIEFDSINLKSYKKRGEVKGRLGDYIGSLVDYKKALKLYSKNLQKLETNDNTITDTVDILRIRNKYINSIVESGTIKYNSGDFKGAVANYSMAIKLYPEHPEAYYLRANGRFLLKDYSGAMEDYSKVIEIRPTNKEAYYAKDYAKLKLGQTNISTIFREKEMNN